MKIISLDLETFSAIDLRKCGVYRYTDSPNFEILLSFGKMKTRIDIVDTTLIKDNEGFSSKGEDIIASVRAYKEERHGSRKWANMAAYTKASVTFQMRRIPDVVIEPGMLIRCDTGEYKVLSIEVIRGVYLEVAAEKIEATKD